MTMTVADLARRWLGRKQDSLTEEELRALGSALARTTVSRDAAAAYAESASLGGRLADAIARVGGSWAFILTFILFLLLWTGVNLVLAAQARFDPYPFIFLNLVLSMLAALQAPVIMMAQNRQAERDRIAAAHDYEVNLKAEIEIMGLHEKMDELRHSEILALRAEVAALARHLQSIDARLGSPLP